MFGFFKRKPSPEKIPTNPGIGPKSKIAFTDGDRTWTETVDVVELAYQAFRKHGYAVRNRTTWLDHIESGYAILPLLVSMQPSERGVSTTTTMQVNHPTLTPKGVFEYQHSFGDTTAGSITAGFEQWLQTDFVTLLDAARDKPKTCTMMDMEFPDGDERAARVRRAILGPVAHYMQKPPPQTEEHPFCPCCMLTRTFDIVQRHLSSDDFTCIRFYAARDENGDPQADCRVNGEDWEEGAEALRVYASSWPEAAFEFRKQYVVLRTLGGRGDGVSSIST
jgi:hypothetical protein